MHLTTTGFQTALEDFLGADTGAQVLAYAATHRPAEQLAGYPALLTVAETAQVLGTDAAGVLAVTGADALPAIEIGATIRRYRRQDVHDYLRFRSEKSAPALA
ncbi:DNA-binding protein (plasmid) [Citricoccus sp. SGAir0253]|uniref:helix-turn-helix domain-containing protein n=1 Tax=Citricoccus sp. SGAir0253 TaxID=2567881 RepID=UPI0010CD635C|nr:helix-turn-helix domain-containing protein [Citricoccus sp. SGAir0253]QCU79576.1 DNA-binding protein [Citricoccus sp. SGAir0253]